MRDVFNFKRYFEDNNKTLILQYNATPFNQGKLTYKESVPAPGTYRKSRNTFFWQDITKEEFDILVIKYLTAESISRKEIQDFFNNTQPAGGEE